MTQTIGQLDFPGTGYLETRRGLIVEVSLSNLPTDPERTYVRFSERAGEFPPGVYSTSVKATTDELDLADEGDGWAVVVELEPEAPDAAVRRDVTLDDGWEWDGSAISIVQHSDDFEPDGTAPEREGELNAFRIELGIDDEGGTRRAIEAATSTRSAPGRPSGRWPPIDRAGTAARAGSCRAP